MPVDITTKTMVDTEWLEKNLQNEDLILADCRYNLIDHSEGRRKYLEGHLPGAYFVDMEADLTGRKGEHGGRHPIPDKDEFARKMRSIGLSKGKTLVAYDDNLSGAARLWWLLKYFGHDDAYVLDGGMPKWMEEKRKTSIELPKEKTGSFSPHENRDLLARVDQVKNLSASQKIVDARARERYEGKVEPIDFKAGHIPGAFNVPYTELMEPEGTLKGAAELRKIFAGHGVLPISYCGSGITSCVNVLALARIGVKSLLYAGSWSDWISYPENEVETGYY